MMKEIQICDCGHAPFPHADCTTGHGIDENGKTKCYECCAEEDRRYLRDHGTLNGYYSKDKEGKDVFTNWAGSFTLPALGIRKSWHNFAGKNGRTDFWVWFEGKCYHGVQIGHFNQCATIRLLKNQPK